MARVTYWSNFMALRPSPPDLLPKTGEEEPPSHSDLGQSLWLVTLPLFLGEGPGIGAYAMHNCMKGRLMKPSNSIPLYASSLGLLAAITLLLFGCGGGNRPSGIEGVATNYVTTGTPPGQPVASPLPNAIIVVMGPICGGGQGGPCHIGETARTIANEQGRFRINLEPGTSYQIMPQAPDISYPGGNAPVGETTSSFVLNSGQFITVSVAYHQHLQ
jgi:hypothetical protein